MVFFIAAIVYSLMFAGVLVWMEFFPVSWAYAMNYKGWLWPKAWGKTEQPKPYMGLYPFVEYDSMDGSPLYDFVNQPSDAKYIDWCYGQGPPPGKGSYDGMQIDEWTWDIAVQGWVKDDDGV